MNSPSFRLIPSTLPVALAAALWSSFPAQAQDTRPATFGTLSSPSGPFVPAAPLGQADPANGIIHEEEFRIKPFVTESLLDQKTASLAVTFCQDGLVPLGRFVMGTVDIRWTAYGWWAGDSGQLSVSYAYGAYDEGPFILSAEGTGLQRVRLLAHRATPGEVDYFLWYDHFNGTSATYPQQLAITFSTNQPFSEVYDTSQLASAVTVPIWQATDVRALKVDFNAPVTVNGDLQVTGTLSIPAKGGISMGIYGVPTP